VLSRASAGGGTSDPAAHRRDPHTPGAWRRWRRAGPFRPRRAHPRCRPRPACGSGGCSCRAAASPSELGALALAGVSRGSLLELVRAGGNVAGGRPTARACRRGHGGRHARVWPRAHRAPPAIALVQRAKHARRPRAARWRTCGAALRPAAPCPRAHVQQAPAATGTLGGCAPDGTRRGGGGAGQARQTGGRARTRRERARQNGGRGVGRGEGVVCALPTIFSV